MGVLAVSSLQDLLADEKIASDQHTKIHEHSDSNEASEYEAIEAIHSLDKPYLQEVLR